MLALLASRAAQVEQARPLGASMRCVAVEQAPKYPASAARPEPPEPSQQARSPLPRVHNQHPAAVVAEPTEQRHSRVPRVAESAHHSFPRRLRAAPLEPLAVALEATATRVVFTSLAPVAVAAGHP